MVVLVCSKKISLFALTDKALIGEIHNYVKSSSPEGIQLVIVAIIWLSEQSFFATSVYGNLLCFLLTV